MQTWDKAQNGHETHNSVQSLDRPHPSNLVALREHVLVLGQNEILSEGLKSIVARVAKFQLIGSATRVDELLNLASIHQPKVVLLAVANGCDSELEAVKTLTDRISGLSVLVLDSQPSVNRMTTFMVAGARGYFAMEANLGELLASLDLKASGIFSADARLADRFRPQLQSGMAADGSAPALNGKKLSDKEKQLLELLAVGKTNQEIADILNYSLSTVKNLCQRLFIKLGAENRLQAVLMTYGRQPNGAA